MPFVAFISPAGPSHNPNRSNAFRLFAKLGFGASAGSRRARLRSRMAHVFGNGGTGSTAGGMPPAQPSPHPTPADPAAAPIPADPAVTRMAADPVAARMSAD